MSFEKYFSDVTGNSPFPYQQRYAEHGDVGILDIPTGLGKTAAIVLGWRWRRDTYPETTPRRLVYCLPMRSLVEQVAASCRQWMAEADRLHPSRPRTHVCVVMGGERDDSYLEAPDQDAIIIGTQDMLLSRALNRGFGLSRYKWPAAFGALNNDCQWVFDETQLQGVGVQTGAQLQGLRSALGSLGGTKTVWASATLDSDTLSTVDFDASSLVRLSLSEDDLAHDVVHKRVHATKRLHLVENELSEKELASLVLSKHVPDSLTLVVVNQVARAQSVYQSLSNALKPSKKSAEPVFEGEAPRIALVHSRFRKRDREAMERILFAQGSRIVVTTQALEAGVDVSAKTMFTDLASWSSLVQRAGRCNRYGEFEDADFYVLPLGSKKNASLPYSEEETQLALRALQEIQQSADSKMSADSIRAVRVPEQPYFPNVIRRRDVLDLFDTSADLSGLDLDISPFIRDASDLDVLFFWRQLEGDNWREQESLPSREELVRFPIGDARKLLEGLKKRREDAKIAPADRQNYYPYVWDGLQDRWQVLTDDQIRPGITVLLHSDAGGYSNELGVFVSSKDAVKAWFADENAAPEGVSGDAETRTGVWIDLTSHLDHVQQEVEIIAGELGVSGSLAEALSEAARWHDVGKAHACFQAMLTKGFPERVSGLWAKSEKQGGKNERKYFRHELASTLAWDFLNEDHPQRDLVAWLIATHHGKIRLSLRALPEELEAPNGGLFARGVWDGDELPAVSLPNGMTTEPLRLSLSGISLGEGSWMSRALALRDSEELGPFRLAGLELLLRAADWRASKKEANHG